MMTRTTEHAWAILDWCGGPCETGETFATTEEAQAACDVRNGIHKRYQVFYLPPTLPYRTTSQFYR